MSFSDLRNVWSSSQSNHLLRHQQAKKNSKAETNHLCFNQKFQPLEFSNRPRYRYSMVPALSPGRIGILCLLWRKRNIGHPGLGGFGSPKVLLTCWGSGILPIFTGFSIYIIPAAGFLKITSCNFVTKPQQMMERINNKHRSVAQR